MVTKKTKLKLRLNAYSTKKGIDYSFEHCDTVMIGVEKTQPHWNCNPIKWQCPICGFIVETDTSSFDCPKPKHITFELEIDTSQNRNKILKSVQKRYLSDIKLD